MLVYVLCVSVCYLSEELLHQVVGPGVVQTPGLCWMTDVCRVEHQRQHLHLVHPGRQQTDRCPGRPGMRVIKG